MVRRSSRPLLFLGLSLVLGFLSGPPALALETYTSASLTNPFGRSAEAQGIALSDDGDVYVSGYIEDDPSHSLAWIARYNSDLVFVSSVTATGNDSFGSNHAIGIDVDDDGFVYAVGFVSDNATGQDIWVAKYDASLVLQSSITINGSGSFSDRANKVIADGSGNLYVVGTITDGSQNFDIWIAKFDTDLTLLQSQTVDGPAGTSDAGYGIGLHGGSVFVSGFVNNIGPNESDIYLGKFTTNLVPVNDLLVDGSGNGPDQGIRLAVDAGGHIYVTGAVTEADDGYNLWVGKFDASLNALASRVVGGAGTDWGHDITVDVFDRVIVAAGVDVTGSGVRTEYRVAAFDTGLTAGALATVTTNGGRAHAVTSDADGNVYAAGYYFSSTQREVRITKHSPFSAATLRAVADPATVVAGSTTQITATVLDSFSTPIPDLGVQFAITAGSGVLNISSGTTTSSGTVTAILTTNGALPSRNRIRITSGQLSTDLVVHSAVQVSSGTGGTVTCNEDPDTKLTIPANAFRELVNIIIKVTGDLSSDDQGKVDRANNKNRGRIISAIVREFNALRQDGSDYGEFDDFVTVEIPYTDNDNDGREDSTGIRVKDLRILRLDELLEIWTEVTDGNENTVDETRKVIRAKLKHFSLYSIGIAAGNLDDVIVYPNPVNFALAVRNTIKFSNLSANAEITIYDVTGRLVRTLPPGTPENDGVSGLAEWNGKNDAGDGVAAGLYYYFIKDDAGHSTKGRLAVKK